MKREPLFILTHMIVSICGAMYAGANPIGAVTTWILACGIALLAVMALDSMGDGTG